MKPVPPDRLRDLIDAVLEALDEGLDGRALAARAMLSPFHFNEWDDVFVDALCTPPVSFTFGSVVAHILTVSVVRRQTVVEALRELGVADPEVRDPIEWERLASGRHPDGEAKTPG